MAMVLGVKFSGRSGPLGLACIATCVTLISVPLLLADPYDPPSDYYATVTGNPATLKSELHLIVADDYWTSLTGPGGTFQPNGSGHKRRSYGDARQALQITDRDPNTPGNIILAYNGASIDGTWTSGATWNREHRWPKSWGLGTSGPDYSDMHQLAPCNPSINGSRGNKAYGQAGSTGTYGPRSVYWFPGDSDVPSEPDFGNDIGDSARVYFYMAVRYEGGEAYTMDLEVRNGSFGQVGSTYYGADLAACLDWHYRDVPSTFERTRNHLLFDKFDNPSYYQGNRNPFADHPEYVWALFGDGANDSQLHVGGSPAGDGSSSATIDFGTVLVGSPVPAAQTVTLNKTGADPTYYSVTTTGDATCDVDAPFNAFTYNAGSRILTVGLPAGVTSSPGSKSGTITIDNLDLTNSGSGTGALDGDDVISVTLNVITGITCPDPFADADEDGDVDIVDHAELQRCLTDSAPASGCLCFDRDYSSSIDVADTQAFLACFSGPNISANIACDD